MRRWVGVGGFVSLVAVLIVGGFLAVDRLAGENDADIVIDKPTLGTTTIVEADLIERETFPAVLRFADPHVVAVSLGGTVTRLPSEGTRLDQGDTALEIDGDPVVLFFGDRPMWRTLALPFDGSDLTGPDVLQLEQNLIDLGYPKLRDDEEELPDVGAPDTSLDEGTVRLIEDWRADLGLADGGHVEMGRILYLDSSVRVARHLTSVSAFVVPGAPVLEVSAAEQEIFLQLDVDRRDLVEVGTPVRVTLPDDVVATATVTKIGSVVTYFDEDAPGLISVSIRLDDPSLWGRIRRVAC